MKGCVDNWQKVIINLANGPQNRKKKNEKGLNSSLHYPKKDFGFRYTLIMQKYFIWALAVLKTNLELVGMAYWTS